MAKSSIKISSLLLIVALMIVVVSVEAGGDHRQQQAEWSWMSAAAKARAGGGGGGCRGSIAECAAEGEFEMDTEVNRRILATTNYISYAALQRNSVPCSQRGASYYNCQPGAEANPYSRGCSAITRCRS